MPSGWIISTGVKANVDSDEVAGRFVEGCSVVSGCWSSKMVEDFSGCCRSEVSEVDVLYLPQGKFKHVIKSVLRPLACDLVKSESTRRRRSEWPVCERWEQ